MSEEAGAAVSPSETPNNDDRRFDVRYPLAGGEIPWRMGKVESTLRLRDLSSGGASCFIEEPLAIGDMIMVEFDPKHHREAEVRWVRRMSVGLRFNRPLDPRYVRNIRLELAWVPQDEVDEFARPLWTPPPPEEGEQQADLPHDEGEQAA